MNFYKIKSSLILKVIIHILLVMCIATIGLLILQKTNKIDISLVSGLSIMIITSLLYIIFMYIEFIRPTKKILHEMKALLTGKRYRRVITTRVDEIGVIGHFFNDITKNLEQISTDLNAHRRITKELDIAHQIQQNLLPQSAPNVDELDIVAKTKPAEEIGGDSFDFMDKENNLFFYIGDVTGHGVPAGLVMIMVDTLLDTFIDKEMNSKDVLTNTNKYLQPKISSTMFMTMVMFRWDKQNKKMYYTGAGHEHVVIYRQSTHKCESYPAGGIALGMVPDNSKMLIEKEIDFQSGDTLILYSDGITEGENSNGELYGLERLKKAAEKFGNLPSSNLIFESISKDFSSFIEGHIQDDDMSIMIVRRK
ncbi:MAG: SpoIIE family protein phosphatase [Candidatus Peregrinibacteria bacterium]|nr:SpoIIE family protein phosphatase [Candidatus Peregrinibacteria bacterium]